MRMKLRWRGPRRGSFRFGATLTAEDGRANRPVSRKHSVTPRISAIRELGGKGCGPSAVKRRPPAEFASCNQARIEDDVCSNAGT